MNVGVGEGGVGEEDLGGVGGNVAVVVAGGRGGGGRLAWHSSDSESLPRPVISS